jgi:hypothetical protein
MFRRFVLFSALCALVPLAAAQDRGFGAGIIFGEPTGISLKGWTSSKNAIDVGLAWSFHGSGSFHIHADYLWHFRDVFPRAERLVLYAGPGGRIRLSSGSSVIGVRIALGAEYWISGAPLDVFLELAPIVDFAPSTEGAMNAGVGIRFFFP